MKCCVGFTGDKNKTQALIGTDTGWQTLIPSSNTPDENGNLVTEPVEVRRIGDVVYLRGHIVSTFKLTQYSKGKIYDNQAVLPTEFIPTDYSVKAMCDFTMINGDIIAPYVTVGYDGNFSFSFTRYTASQSEYTYENVDCDINTSWLMNS